MRSSNSVLVMRLAHSTLRLVRHVQEHSSAGFDQSSTEYAILLPRKLITGSGHEVVKPGLASLGFPESHHSPSKG